MTTQPQTPPTPRYSFVVRFTSDEETTIVQDQREPKEVIEAWRKARVAAFGKSKTVDPDSGGIMAFDSGGFLVGSIEGISILSPVEEQQLNAENSRTVLRLAQAKAIEAGQVPPDGVGRNGEVIPFNEQDVDEEDEEDEEDENDDELPRGAPAGLAGLAGGK